MKKSKLCIVDIECTCPKVETDHKWYPEIISIGIVKCSIPSFLNEEYFYKTVKPFKNFILSEISNLFMLS